jgi:hypothetical protein
MGAAAVRFKVSLKEGQYWIEIFKGDKEDTPDLEFFSRDSAQEISNSADNYAVRTQAAKESLNGRDETSYDAAFAFIKEVHSLGHRMMRSIFGEKYVDVSKLLIEIAGVRDLDVLPPPLRYLKVIAVDSGRLFFPIELMPLLNTREPSGRSWLTAAGSFVGMCFAIDRINRHLEGSPTNNLLNSDARLSMRVFYNVTLRGANDELDFFRSGGPFSLDAVWPTDAAPPRKRGLLSKLFFAPPEPVLLDVLSATKEIAEHLMCHRMPGQTSKLADVLHFCCHYDRDPASKDHSFSFCGLNGRPIEISISRLDERTGYIADEERRKREDSNSAFAVEPSGAALVFLNACATGREQVGDFISVKRLLVDLGHRGVIVTETSMPDAYAKTFSRCFYESLFLDNLDTGRKRSVGEAIHRAKWETLKDEKNPLGLFYNLYGNPDLFFYEPPSPASRPRR